MILLSLAEFMTLLQDWTNGEAAGDTGDCSNLGCSFVGDSNECLKNCLDDPDCSLVNFCPLGATCTSGENRCCLRNCLGDNYELTSEWNGWDIYIKSMLVMY